MTIDELREQVLSRLQTFKPQIDLNRPNRIIISVEVKNLIESASLLKQIGFDHVKSVTATDYTDDKYIEIIYHISAYEDNNLTNFILSLKTSVLPENPRMPSLTSIWPSAELLERETFDLLGVVFDGHPKLSRILLPDDWNEPPPLLKKYKIPTEGIEVE